MKNFRENALASALADGVLSIAFWFQRPPAPASIEEEAEERPDQGDGESLSQSSKTPSKATMDVAFENSRTH